MNLIHLFLFYNNTRSSATVSYAGYLSTLLGAHPNISLTVIETDQQSIKTVQRQKSGLTTTIRIPRPENGYELSPVHCLQQHNYARRLTDILYPYLQGQNNYVFLADSVKYVRIFEVLKERYNDARFIYLHQEWSWKRYLDLSDAMFAGYWRAGDIKACPGAFKLTAYEQKIALTADKTVTVSEQDTRFFHDVLDIPLHRLAMIPSRPDQMLTSYLQLLRELTACEHPLL